jgi:subtilisin
MTPKREEQESRTASASRLAGTEERATRERGAPGAETENVVNLRKVQVLISARPQPGFQSFTRFDLLEQNLRNDPDLQVIDVLTPRGSRNVFDDGIPGSQRVIVARTHEEKAAQLVNQAGYQLIVERDYPLSYGRTTLVPMSLDPADANQGAGFTTKITVMGDDLPVEGAQVCIFGSFFPRQGVTDRQGRVELNAVGESSSNIHAIYVKPQSDFWSIWIPQPVLNPDGNNVISLTSLSATLPNFSRQQWIGWGERVMGLENLSPTFRGKGVKIAIIDSGAAITHRNIKGRVKVGYNALTKTQEGWEEDAIGRGTHCTGIVGGTVENGIGIRGLAPDAEIIPCKLFPGGRYSNLFDALDFCISRQVDVIQLSLTGAQPSEIIEQKLYQAKHLGIACIAAAGDSGGPVQYPALSPHVLAVAAIGKQGEFPPDSYHAQSARPPLTPQGFFSPNFTCYGPQIGVCAPGVAVVSSAPPDDFVAWDGTSIAAAHISGLAALILAHHPDFQAEGLFGARNTQRVDRLFQIMRQSGQQLNLGDLLRTGAGLPNATRAFLPHAALTGMPVAAFPNVSGVLQSGTPYFAGTPFGGQGIVGSASAPFLYVPFWGGGAPGAWPPTQTPENMWLLAVHQLRNMMQSTGLV